MKHDHSIARISREARSVPGNEPSSAKVSRRNLLILTGTAALGHFLAGVANAETEPAKPATQPETREILDRAVDAFWDGWFTGNWEPFLALLADEFTFQFPTGPHRGRHTGREGKRRISEWARHHGKNDNRIIESNIDLRLYQGDWIVVCDRGSGRIGGNPYTGLHAIFMKAEQGTIVEFREYFGELPA